MSTSPTRSFTYSQAKEYVSGVELLPRTTVFTMSVNQANLGSYYFPSPVANFYITNAGVNSNIDINRGVTNIGNALSTVTTTNSNTYDWNITATYSSANSSLFYAGSYIFGGVTRNVDSTTRAISEVTIPVIIDQPSIDLKGLISRNNIPVVRDIINGSYVVGSLYTRNNIGSYTTADNIITPANQTLAYDHTISLLTNNALQISNGLIRTYASRSTTGYLDYTSYGGPNYSTGLTTGMRYSLFAWKLITTTNSYSAAASIKITNVSNLYKATDGTIRLNSTSGPLLSFRYKIHNFVGDNGMQSNWINANTYTGTAINSANFNIPERTDLYGLESSPLPPATDVIFPVTMFPSTQRVRDDHATLILVEVGCDTSIQFSFKTIECLVSF